MDVELSQMGALDCKLRGRGLASRDVQTRPYTGLILRQIARTSPLPYMDLNKPDEGIFLCYVDNVISLLTDLHCACNLGPSACSRQDSLRLTAAVIGDDRFFSRYTASSSKIWALIADCRQYLTAHLQYTRARGQPFRPPAVALLYESRLFSCPSQWNPKYRPPGS